MHWFEQKFASIGRGIDQVIERLRDRRPARFKPRVGPSLGERIKDRVHDAKTAVATGEWKQHVEMGGVARRRLIVLGSALLVSLAAAGVYQLIRPGPPRLNEQEIMDLAMVRARIELGGTVGGGGSDKPFGGFGAGPLSTSQPAGGSPAPLMARPSATPSPSQMPLPVRGGGK